MSVSLRNLLQREPPQVYTTARRNSRPQSLTALASALTCSTCTTANSSRGKTTRTFMLEAWRSERSSNSGAYKLLFLLLPGVCGSPRVLLWLLDCEPADAMLALPWTLYHQPFCSPMFGFSPPPSSNWPQSRSQSNTRMAPRTHTRSSLSDNKAIDVSGHLHHHHFKNDAHQHQLTITLTERVLILSVIRVI